MCTLRFLQYNIRTELESTIEFDVGFTATLILHPATYLNKILVSSSQGSIQLWNIRSQLVFFNICFSFPTRLAGLVYTNSLHLVWSPPQMRLKPATWPHAQ